ncbi:MAG: hypothetical protein RLZZ385_237 [Pseudomonadota bacterium]|jgi:16S rRNA processing protein RimM
MGTLNEGDGEAGWVVLGRIGRIHGIKGWLKLQSFTEPRDNITTYTHFAVPGTAAGRLLEMDDIKPLGNGYIAHFRGFDAPEQARELTGLELAVARDTLPTLAANEYYWHQLMGLAVINQAGDNLGRVIRLLETGANDVLVVQGTEQSIDQRERLLPYRWEQVIKTVDLAKQLIEVDWPADYLA